MVQHEVRWQQRFQHFHASVANLREPVARGVDTLSQLEAEGTIQRFEIAFELAWKTLKDYLAHEGLLSKPVTPRRVIKQAFAAQVIPNGQLWITMLADRNALSHTYNAAQATQAVRSISDRYFPALQALDHWFTTQRPSQPVAPRVDLHLVSAPSSPWPSTGLTPSEWWLILGVLDSDAAIEGAILFGSRAMGTACPSSDIDLALEGSLDRLHVAHIAAMLDELPLPYLFDVVALATLDHHPLRDHIAQDGLRVYSAATATTPRVTTLERVRQSSTLLG